MNRSNLSSLKYAFVVPVLVLFACSTPARTSEPQIREAEFPKPCSQDPTRQKARSDELQQIVQADQDDRKDWLHLTAAQITQVAWRDLGRRKRVGEIFGEGCFSGSKDYEAAALVFQHGDAPDHYYQTFIWSKRAVELGDTKQKDLMAKGIDRYLVSTGKKQLFASQAHAKKVEACYCLQQVELSFPDARRQEYTGRTLGDQLKWVDSLNVGRGCPSASECPEPLLPTPKGSIVGFW